MKQASKTHTLEALREESPLILSGIRLILFGYIVWAIFLALVLLGGLLFHNWITESLNSQEGPLLLSLLAEGFTDGHPLNAQGHFNVPLMVFFVGAGLVSAATSIYIFLSILRIFKNISRGESPFSSKNAEYWKNCARMYGVLLVVTFLSAFIIKPLIFGILSPLMGYCFFSALGQIFEYGSFLQTESDETL